jgi:Putative Flp pilus-assembly TadE/G-like
MYSPHHGQYISGSHKAERGITILLVAAAMVGVLAMAALAVDIVALYVAKSEAQRAADASALAAAKMFVSSGYTSNSSAITQSELCQSGAAGLGAAANKAAESSLAQNLVVSQAATLQTITCDFTQPTNPLVTITVQRTGLPTLFGRIWSAGTGSVSATAKAEAFNPSGGSTNVAVGSVKPWLVANDCPSGGCGPWYFDASFNVVTPAILIGTQQSFTLLNARSGQTPTGFAQFYALDPPQPNSCPSNSAVSCTNIGTGPPGIFYHDNIACSNTAFRYSCGQTISSSDPVHVDVRAPGTLQTRTSQGITCLIHASGVGAPQCCGQDTINATTPVTIDGGSNNPNTALQGTPNISRRLLAPWPEKSWQVGSSLCECSPRCGWHEGISEFGCSKGDEDVGAVGNCC